MSVNIVLVVQFVEDFSAGGIAGIAIYGIVYFAVCLRMVWEEVVTLAKLPGAWYRGELGQAPTIPDEFADPRALELTRQSENI